MVHGGDGFSFVMQLDPNGTEAVGMRGEGLGYGGIRNALVVEFDTWYVPPVRVRLCQSSLRFSRLRLSDCCRELPCIAQV
jgi:hypothetical protein